MKRQTYILGGGTFQPIRNHLALCAPAFGTTAKTMKELMPEANLILTKMADSNANLVTNEDVEGFIDSLLISDNVGTIILNVAFCDYKALPIEGVESGIHAERLKTSEGNITIELTPTEKIIAKIRKARPDIFLVGSSAEKVNDKIIKAFEGRIVGIEEKHTILLDNKIYDLKTYEIISQTFNK